MRRAQCNTSTCTMLLTHYHHSTAATQSFCFIKDDNKWQPALPELWRHALRCGAADACWLAGGGTRCQWERSAACTLYIANEAEELLHVCGSQHACTASVSQAVRQGMC